MDTRHEVPASLTAFGADPTPATLTLAARSPGRRLLSPLVGLAVCWVVAAIAVFMPVVHFVAVPGLTLAGLAWAFIRLRERQRLLGVHGRCPPAAPSRRSCRPAGRATTSRSIAPAASRASWPAPAPRGVRARRGGAGPGG
jgi:hypothetical protein